MRHSKKVSISKEGRRPIDKESNFNRIENWLIKRERIAFYCVCILCLLFSILLFNARVSEGNDDSLYIEAGYNYASDFLNYSYTANAPLYPLFLGLLIKIFGINLILFKIFSVIFNFIGIVFLYLGFRKRIPYLILFTICFLVASNNYFQYFASQTYTEPLYLALQFVFLYSFFKIIDRIPNENEKINLHFCLQWLLIGGLLFVLIMTRNAALVIIPAIILFFIIIKKYKYILWLTASYLLFKIPYEFFHSVLWKHKDQYSSQSAILLLKDPYNASKGNDDFAGFVSRFFDNIQLYLSKRFFQILGFFSENHTETNTMWSLIVIILLIVGFTMAYRSKNLALFFSVFLMSSIVFITFVMLQARWDQPRLIMVHVPIILLTILFGLYQLLRKSSYAQNIFIVICFILVSSSFISSTKRAVKNIPIVVKNLKGDKYFGYTPDWSNFFKLGEWCSVNLEDTALVASRKASMSFIYGNGKQFFPVYKVYALDTTTGYSNPDSVLALFRRQKVTHIILASLRRDPSKADGNVINTLHRMLEPVAKKYPEKIRLVHQIPSPEEAQIEPAYLYKINY